MGEEPFLYLTFESTYIIAANGIIVHQEIGIWFMLLNQMANPVRFSGRLSPKVGRRRRSKRVVLIWSRVKVGVAFDRILESTKSQLDTDDVKLAD